MKDEELFAEDAEWEEITDAHARDEERTGRAAARAAAANPAAMRREMFKDFREKRYQHRKESVAVAAARYATLAAGLGAMGYITRNTEWLSVTMVLLALVFALVAAYGAGKYRQM